ncbi:HAMP domain-containing protein [Candidatus Babeliales bacterium]|nr:HAMP domain-containing protein [Candidatus Babeliales bacterium]
MNEPLHKRRLLIIVLSIGALFVTSWLELFLQRKHNLIGAGINRSFFFLLINVHVIVIVALLYLIIRQSIKLFIERHKGLPGSAFKRNLLFAFTFFSVIPSFFVFFTAGKIITTSIDHWFHARISTGLASGMKLHKAQTQTLRQELAAASTLVAANNPTTQQELEQTIQDLQEQCPILAQCSVYCWPQEPLHLVTSLNQEIERWRLYRTFNDRSVKHLRDAFLARLHKYQARQDSVFDFFGSLYWVQKIGENYLCVAYRYPAATRVHLIDMQNSLDDYYQLQSMRNPIYYIYLFTFILVTLLILFLSIWCAFYLARGISTPIQELLEATERIKSGHWDVHVNCDESSDLHTLAHGFNEMISAVNRAHTELESKNTEMLAILENMKASVFFVNKFARITMNNRAAKELVAKYLNLNRFKNRRVNFFGHEVKAKFIELTRKLAKTESSFLSEEISFNVKGENRILMIHLSAISTSNGPNNVEKGLLIVIEDLTDIVKASKIKTWQEAAKQVAHEIKNPLTPIQLATQRLQRKYRPVLEHEPIFMDCTSTILHQVNIIKDLAAHFSEFASMPAPHIETADLNDIITEILRFYRVSYPSIHFTCLLKSPPVIKTDIKKIKRVLINLLDNSVRALLEKNESSKSIKIETKILPQTNKLELIIADNGPGIEAGMRDKLFLPYVSSNKKNMGLGLAIVHDIVTQLGGNIQLLATKTGAIFQILLNLE